MELIKENYINFLNDLQFSSDEIKNQIKDYKLQFIKIINSEIEDGLRLTPFIKTFYFYLLEYGKIPSQKEFWEEYQKEKSIEKILLDKNKFDGLKARVYRVYPSLIRDIHFSTLLKEKSKNCEVIYNIDLDYTNGIDILIDYKSNLFGVNLFVDTDRSNSYRNKKFGRHKKITNVYNIDIPVKFTEEYKFHDFYLYGENEIEKIKKEIIKQI